MAYLKIDNVDFSMYVNELKVNNTHKYNAQENAAGDTVVDYINKKRTITVGIIPLNSAAMANLQSAIDKFNVSISYRDPQTNELETGVNCIIPTSEVEYYTIQANKVLYNAFTLTFIEL